jgi:hypothetical protein
MHHSRGCADLHTCRLLLAACSLNLMSILQIDARQFVAGLRPVALNSLFACCLTLGARHQVSLVAHALRSDVAPGIFVWACSMLVHTVGHIINRRIPARSAAQARIALLRSRASSTGGYYCRRVFPIARSFLVNHGNGKSNY